MALSQAEFDALLVDGTKRIAGDIVWAEDEDHSPARVFRVDVTNVAGYPLFIKGEVNLIARKLHFSLIMRGEGRVYGLCLGTDHPNPDGRRVGEKHKHRFIEKFRDREAYVPDDITSDLDDPASVWGQFCAEAGIMHDGTLGPVPGIQGELF